MLKAAAAFARLIARFRRAKDGSAAVEFSLVALPFFLLTFGLAEVAMIGYTQTSLDYAAGEVGRKIRTGEMQGQGLGYQQVKDMLCTEVQGLMPLDCSKLYLDVDTFASFVSVTNASPVQNGAISTAGFGYNPGVSSDIVVVRTYYQWQVMTPFFQGVFANVAGGQRVLSSTLMFRNEPYSGAAS